MPFSKFYESFVALVPPALESIRRKPHYGDAREAKTFEQYFLPCHPYRPLAENLALPAQNWQAPEYSFGNRCKISLVSTGPQLVRPAAAPERNWIPVAVAAAVVLAVAAGLVLILGHGKRAPQVTPISASPDPYAASLPISGLVMSESANLAGGKVTYLDGHIANVGNRTVTGVSVQILFRDVAREVTQNETHPLRLIRTRDPYVDLEPVSAAPLKPGGEQDFRLIFDAVSPDWDGAYPELRIIHVDSK
jgi:hypothetical protein